MYKLQINDLNPGQKYYVKVRAKAPGYTTSEWSPVFDFITEQDQIPPERVKNLSFVSEGDSFIASWEAPEFNMDGTICTDLSHYVIKLVNANATKTVQLQSSVPEFTMDFNRNKQLFGTPSGIVEIIVFAVDLVGNEGPESSEVAQNMPPVKIENVSAEASIESIDISWDATIETDIEKYHVYASSDASFEPDYTNLRGSVGVGTTSLSHTTRSLSPLYFIVTAVDKFNQESPPSNVATAQPKLSTDIDRTPPAVVLGLSVQQELASDSASAIAVVTYDPVVDENLDKYEIQYRATGDSTRPWSFTNIPSDETSAEIKSLFLATDYDFRIRAVDINGNQSPWSNLVVASGVKKDSLPDSPTSVTVSGGLTNLMVTWTASVDPSMVNWAGIYEVQVDETIGFEDPLTINAASTLASFTNLKPDTNYYVRVRSIDPYGNVGEWSTIVFANTGNVETDMSNIYWSDTEPAQGKENDLWVKLPENVQYRYDGSGWIKSQDLELGGKNRNIYSAEDASGRSLNGIPFVNGDTWFKRNSDNAIIKMWEFYNNAWIVKEISNLAPDSVTATAIAADAVTADKILAREITGEHLAANTAIVNNLKITSSVEINEAGGHIKSSNYDDTGVAGFYMDQQQLIINQGRIKAAALELQDSANLLPPAIAGLSFRPKAYEQMIHVENGSYQIWPNAGRGYTGGLLLEGSNAHADLVSLPYTSVDAGDKYILSGYVGIFVDYDQQIIPSRVSIQAAYVNPVDDTIGPIFFASDEEAINVPHYNLKRIQVVFTAPGNGVVAVRVKNHNMAAVASVWSAFQLERVIGASEVASAWKPPGATEISGDSIRTGEITSNQSVNTPNGFIPKWSINTEGNARFADAVIDGTLTVGVDEVDDEGNSDISIQSDTYDPGVEGWAIKGNGDVEFNNGTFRGILNLEKADLSMKASVSGIKSYTTADDFEEINTANIRGTTYAYHRQEKGDTGVFLPYEPDTTRRGHFFIGPTTERALNIQVHDGPEEDSVYLAAPPKNLTVTSLNIGEQTDSASSPEHREDQGIRFRTYRDDSRGYTLGGVSTTNDLNITHSLFESATREKSAVIPEGMGGAEEYPGSSHEWLSSNIYETPGGKNLFGPDFARSVAAPGSSVGGQFYAAQQSQFASQSGLGSYSIVVVPETSPSVDWRQIQVVAPSTGPYIWSFYVNTETLASPLYIAAEAHSVHMTPNEPIAPDHTPPSGINKSEYTMIAPGIRSQRVSFYSASIPSGSLPLGLKFFQINRSRFYLTKMQFEQAVYRSDSSLPAEMRNSYEPTPWTVNGAKISTTATFSLKSEPFVDPMDNKMGTRILSQAYPSIDKGIEASSPVEATLRFDTQYDSMVEGDQSSASAEYKFSPSGLKFPGRHVPFLPAGLTVAYDYMPKIDAERPRIGGSTGGRSLLLNDALSFGDANVIEERFSRGVNRTSNFSYQGWSVVGQNGQVAVSNARLITVNPNMSGTNDGYFYMYRNDALNNTDQSVSIKMTKYMEWGGLYTMSSVGGPVINLNPSTGERIVVSYDEFISEYRIWQFMDHNTRVMLASGTIDLPSTPAFVLTLSRKGNVITFSGNGSVIRTVTSGSFPNGLHVGLNPRRGGFAEFRATDSAEVSDAPGVLESYSMNLNNGRGLTIDSLGNIYADAPGYYHVSATVEPSNPSVGFGDHQNDQFLLHVNTDVNSRTIRISQAGGQRARRLQGSSIAYLAGPVRFYAWSNDGDSTSIGSSQIQVVRVS